MLIDRRLASAARSAIPWLVSGVLARLLGLAASIVLAVIAGAVVAEIFQGQGDVAQLTATYGWPALAAVALRVAIIPVADRCQITAAARARDDLRALTIRAALTRRPDGSMPSTEAATLVVSGIESLESYFGRYLPQLAYSVTAPLVLLVVVASVSPLTALVMLAVIPVTFILIGGLLAVAGRRAGSHFSAFGALATSFVESVHGLQTLTLFRRDEARAAEFSRLTEGFRGTTMRLLKMQLSSIVIMDLAAYGGAAAAIVTALGQTAVGALAVGPAVAIVLLSSEFFLPVRALGGAFHVAMTGVAASKRLFAFVEENADMPAGVAGVHASADSGAARATSARSGARPTRPEPHASTREVTVELDNVTYHYPGSETPALSGVSLRAGRGVTAIVGESGSGKSTIASLIAGLRSAGTGSVVAPPARLVAQGSYIFTGTIADNLRLAAPDATDEELLDACRRVRLSDVVGGVDDLARHVGEAGAALSGGQRQKLAFARALLIPSEVMVFDEATSNIDSESEADLLEVMTELGAERAVIVITHRVAGLSGVDTAVVLDRGTVIAHGAPSDLLRQSAEFRRLSGLSEEEVSHV